MYLFNLWLIDYLPLLLLRTSRRLPGDPVSWQPNNIQYTLYINVYNNNNNNNNNKNNNNNNNNYNNNINNNNPVDNSVQKKEKMNTLKYCEDIFT